MINVALQPSIQKLVGNLAQDAAVYLTEEATHTGAFLENIPGVINALTALKEEYPVTSEDHRILAHAIQKVPDRAAAKNRHHEDTVNVVPILRGIN